MIPKIIHYCWFGESEKPEFVKKCIQSWKKYCPNYEIVEWNESNFDVNCCAYVKEAYQCKKWAFVSDYARLWIIYHKGGIYLDTDIELIKNLDVLINNDAYFGYEDPKHINTGVGFGAIKGHDIVKAMLEDYHAVHFLQQDGEMDLTPCPVRNSKVLEARGYLLDGHTKQQDKVKLYSQRWLCPIDYHTGKMEITEETVSIHHYNGTWMEPYELKIIAIERCIKKIIGTTVAYWIRCRLYNLYHMKQRIQQICKS